MKIFRNTATGELNGFYLLAALSVISAILSAAFLFIPWTIWSLFWAMIWGAAGSSSERRANHRERMERLAEETNRLLKEEREEKD